MDGKNIIMKDVEGLILEIDKCTTEDKIMKWIYQYLIYLKNSEIDKPTILQLNKKVIGKIEELGYNTTIVFDNVNIEEEHNYVKWIISRFISSIGSSTKIYNDISNNINKWLHKYGAGKSDVKDEINFIDFIHKYDYMKNPHNMFLEREDTCETYREAKDKVNQGNYRKGILGEIEENINKFKPCEDMEDTIRWFLEYSKKINDCGIEKNDVIVFNTLVFYKLVDVEGITEFVGGEITRNSKQKTSEYIIHSIYIMLDGNKDYRLDESIIAEMNSWLALWSNKYNTDISNLKSLCDYVLELIPRSTLTDYGNTETEQVLNYVKQHL